MPRHTKTEVETSHLLIADFRNSEGHYANAFVWRHLIATANHVAQAKPRIMTPDGKDGQFDFESVGSRDLSLSVNEIPHNPGYEQLHIPTVGEVLYVRGHHGKQRAFFQIAGKVLQIARDGRILIKAIPMMGMQKEKLLRRKLCLDDFEMVFQDGMSGSPSIFGKNAVSGVLVSPGGGDFRGHRVYLESAAALVRCMVTPKN